MKFKSSIKIYEDPQLVYDCFQKEASRWDRSSLKLKKAKDHIEFIIEARDPTALRATFNSVMKSLTVFEKMGNIK